MQVRNNGKNKKVKNITQDLGQRMGMLSEESMSTENGKISGSNSQIGHTPKQKPYTSFIESAHRRKTYEPISSSK